MAFYIFHRHRVCLGDHVDLFCSFILQEGFGSSFSATLPLGSIVVLFPPLQVGCLLGFAPQVALEDLGLPL